MMSSLDFVFIAFYTEITTKDAKFFSIPAFICDPSRTWWLKKRFARAYRTAFDSQTVIILHGIHVERGLIGHRERSRMRTCDDLLDNTKKRLSRRFTSCNDRLGLS